MCEYVTRLDEIYFDNPIPVRDSFFFGDRWKLKYPVEFNKKALKSVSFYPPQYVMHVACDPDVALPTGDDPQLLHWDLSEWGGIFPILAPPCWPAERPEAEAIEPGVARVWWSGDGDSVQLSIERDSTAPTGRWLTTHAPSDTSVVIDFGTDSIYFARIRRRCPYGVDKWSHWSDYVVIIPGTPEPPAGVAGVERQGWTIVPNPAVHTATVRSVEPLLGVDVVDNGGRLVLRQSTRTIDVSPLPAGTYTVRITTPTGVFSKPMVVK